MKNEIIRWLYRMNDYIQSNMIPTDNITAITVNDHAIWCNPNCAKIPTDNIDSNMAIKSFIVVYSLLHILL